MIYMFHLKRLSAVFIIIILVAITSFVGYKFIQGLIYIKENVNISLLQREQAEFASFDGLSGLKNSEGFTIIPLNWFACYEFHFYRQLFHCDDYVTPYYKNTHFVFVKCIIFNDSNHEIDVHLNTFTLKGKKREYSYDVRTHSNLIAMRVDIGDDLLNPLAAYHYRTFLIPFEVDDNEDDNELIFEQGRPISFIAKLSFSLKDF